MLWNAAFTPAIWLCLITLIFMLALAAYSWRRRRLPGALPFTYALLFGVLWSAGAIFEYLAVDPGAKIFWVKFQAAWQLPGATAITWFLVEYAWPGRWVNRRVLLLLSIPPLLLDLLILSDHLHHLMWRGFVVNTAVRAVLGPASWLAIAYGYAFMVVNIIVLAWLFLRSPQHRWFVVIVLAGQVFLRTMYLIDKTLTIQTNLPLDVFGITFAYLMYTIALFRSRIWDPILLARQTAITQMREGMLVLDPEGRVAGLNPAAEQILGVPIKQVMGRPVRELLPAYQGGYMDGEETDVAFSVGNGQEARHYTMAISSLKDWRGLAVGRLLLLHDVTGQTLAQAQIVEQQRALATLKEREQVARELHDFLAQELAFLNVQAQLVAGLLEAGQAEQALAQLKLLAKLAREAHVDVRGEIRTLSLSVAPGGGFLGALRHHLDIFQQMYAVKTELALPDGPDGIPFLPTVEVQLLRIVQEAFTNIGKHAQATLVRVDLVREPECVALVIEDDGVGFDPQSAPRGGRSFGLGIMGERAREINARMEVISSPGKGTRIRVEVPVEAPVNNQP